jgi:serine/threonine-protein phosphatase 5
LALFASAGKPSEKNLFVFNGDFVDRGAWGVEVLSTLLSWKLCYPESVFLTRGNHESSSCTMAYGFYKELSLKYPDSNWERIYQLCKGVFASLPLCAIIEEKVYVAHGGLFRDPQAKQGKGGKKHKAKKRKQNNKELKVGNLRQLRAASKGGVDPDNAVASQLISTDVLWSDPQSCKGLSDNENRGIGLLFGPDMTEHFLSENKLKLIIRSHEGPDSRIYREDMKSLNGGYSIDHEVASGSLVTVFSAPDYPQFADPEERTFNLAAYVVLSHPDISTPEFKQFPAKPRPQMPDLFDEDD